eukprot:8812553-Alexandrium_andersonii.AAC.1
MVIAVQCEDRDHQLYVGATQRPVRPDLQRFPLARWQDQILARARVADGQAVALCDGSRISGATELPRSVSDLSSVHLPNVMWDHCSDDAGQRVVVISHCDPRCCRAMCRTSQAPDALDH